MFFEALPQYLLTGLGMGAVYALIAMGFSIIYNSTGVINFAQGEWVMLGALLTISFAKSIPLPLAILVACLLVGLLGAMVYLVFFQKPMPLLSMIGVTIGLSLLFQGLAMQIWGRDVHFLPPFNQNEVLIIFEQRLPWQYLFILSLLVIIGLLLYWFFQKTFWGLGLRAMADNPTGAKLCGLPAIWMGAASFALSGIIAGLAGAFVVPITLGTYQMGTSIALKGFTALVLGGLGSYSGAILAGLSLGLVESFSSGLISSAYRDALVLFLLLITLLWRPQGILNRRHQEIQQR